MTPAQTEALVALVEALIAAANRRKGLPHGVARVTAEYAEAQAYDALLAWTRPPEPAALTPTPEAAPLITSLRERCATERGRTRNSWTVGETCRDDPEYTTSADWCERCQAADVIEGRR